MRLYVVFQKDNKDFRAGMVKKGNAGLEYIEYKKITAISDIKNPKEFIPFVKGFVKWSGLKTRLGVFNFWSRFELENEMKKFLKAKKIWVHKKSQWD